MKRESETAVMASPAESRAVVLRMKQVIERLGVSRSTVYDWMNPQSPRHAQDFPLPIRLSAVAGRGAVGWLESDICRWIESRDCAVSRAGGRRHA